MIEVNLLPGGKKRSSRSFSFSLPRFGGGGAGAPDPYMMFVVAAGVVALGYMGWAFMSQRAAAEELQVTLDGEIQDSIRWQDLIARTNELNARRDSIAQRVAIIQDIDAGRYVWPHILDEVARAVPDYTWLREIIQVSSDFPLQFRISGRTGNNFAMTAFGRNLEDSPFLRDVQIERSQQQPSEVSPADLVTIFEFLVTYDPPSLDMLETVPLFADGTGVTRAAAADTVGR